MKVDYVPLAAIGALSAVVHGSALSIAPLISSYCSTAKSLGSVAASALSLIAIHNLAVYISMLLMAILIFLFLGLRVLKRLWINYDLLSNVTLMSVGMVFLATQAVQWITS